jgi:hypothetical protein
MQPGVGAGGFLGGEFHILLPLRSSYEVAMDYNQRLQAAALAIGLSWGYVQLDEAIAWADKLIVESEVPAGEIVELSVTQNAPDAIESLNAIAAAVDKWMALSLLLRRLSVTRIFEPKAAATLAKRLFFEVTRGDPPAEFRPFFGYWDDLDLAIDGIVGNPEELTEQFLRDIRIAASISD